MDKRNCRTLWQIWLLIVILLAAAPAVQAADEVVIKMATIAPGGSEWHQVLQQMGAEWQKASRGLVQFRLRHHGELCRIEVNPAEPVYIQTVHRIGYRFSKVRNSL